jgi:AraC-like DNA-binding protein
MERALQGDDALAEVGGARRGAGAHPEAALQGRHRHDADRLPAEPAHRGGQADPGAGDTPVEEISAAVGYEDASFFRRLFKRKTGLTAGASLPADVPGRYGVYLAAGNRLP